MESPFWNTITPSQYEWERRALDLIRAGLPDHEPYRAWSNFEFQTPDGAICEIDLLVLTKQGFWLVEVKSWPGESVAMSPDGLAPTTAKPSPRTTRCCSATTKPKPSSHSSAPNQPLVACAYGPLGEATPDHEFKRPRKNEEPFSG